jgi:hypothetical protein
MRALGQYFAVPLKFGLRIWLRPFLVAQHGTTQPPHTRHKEKTIGFVALSRLEAYSQ